MRPAAYAACSSIHNHQDIFLANGKLENMIRKCSPVLFTNKLLTLPGSAQAYFDASGIPVS